MFRHEHSRICCKKRRRVRGIGPHKNYRLNNTCRVLIPTTDFSDGSRKWLQGTGPDWVEENAADAYIEKQVNFDRDCWVIEIEDREGRHFLDEKVEV